MSSIVDSLTQIYVFVADYMLAHPEEAGWRQSHNAQPDFTDAEVITIGLIQGSLGVATLKQTYELIAANHRDCFPRLCSYPRWIARLHALQPLCGRLVVAALAKHRMPARVYLMDTKPIPVCKPIRHGRVRLLRDEGAYFGKNSVGWYFGFKIHVLMHKDGGIFSVLLTSANRSDKEVEINLLLASAVEGGLALADRGYHNRELRQELKERLGLGLLTPADVPPAHRLFLSQERERIETVFSQLWSHFVDRVYSRSWLGLWNTVLLKIAHYNLHLAGILTEA